MNLDYRKLVGMLEYEFEDEAHLVRALTHRSAGSRHNERLEFLGDSVLNFVIAQALFERFPTATEGELSRLRANLVREATLADVARTLDLGEYLRLGSGELKSGGFRRGSILADGIEAIFGAVLLDGGFHASQKLILRLYQARIALADPNVNLKDPKSRLQEYLQSEKKSLPEYIVLSVDGAQHNQLFKVECRIPELQKCATGEGRTRRKAEQAAAKLALEQLEVKDS